MVILLEKGYLDENLFKMNVIAVRHEVVKSNKSTSSIDLLEYSNL